MAASTGTYLAVASIVSALGGAYESKRSTDFAKSQAHKQERAASKMLSDEEDERKRSARQAALFAMRGRGGPGLGRESVRTSPLGGAGQLPGSAKTLLGQ